MSALKSRSNSLAGLTLDAVLGGEPILPQPPPSPPQKPITTTQTLFDIIREEYAQEGQKDRTTWQIFREKLRLKRSGSAWTSSLPIPTSDILIPTPKQRGVTFRPHSAIPRSDPRGGMFTRGSSMRMGSTKNPEDVNIPGDGPPSRSFKPQLSRRDSVNQGDGEEDSRRRPPVVTFVEERQMSAREAIAAQETAEAAGNETSDEGEEDDEENEEDDSREVEETTSTEAPKQTMSLFDLLGETDRQMGLIGSAYAMDDDEEYYEDEEDEEYEEDEDGGGEGELNCSVCDVKIKGASSSPCAHTFCKLCSKELMAQKGHCPVCSGFVLEFLEIF